MSTLDKISEKIKNASEDNTQESVENGQGDMPQMGGQGGPQGQGQGSPQGMPGQDQQSSETKNA